MTSLCFSSCFEDLIQYSLVTCSLLLRIQTAPDILLLPLSCHLWAWCCETVSVYFSLWCQEKWDSTNKKTPWKELVSVWVLQTSCDVSARIMLLKWILCLGFFLFDFFLASASKGFSFVFSLSLFCLSAVQNNCYFWFVLLKILIFI